MKASKKIIGASCALVAAVALSAGSTFAWFTSNSQVQISSINAQVVTEGGDLRIAEVTVTETEATPKAYSYSLTAPTYEGQLGAVTTDNGYEFYKKTTVDTSTGAVTASNKADDGSFYQFTFSLLSTTDCTVYLDAGSVLTSVAASPKADSAVIKAWKELTAEDYGHEAVTQGSDILAEAQNAARVSFVVWTVGSDGTNTKPTVTTTTSEGENPVTTHTLTNGEVKYWAPHDSKGGTITDGFYKGNLAADYMAYSSAGKTDAKNAAYYVAKESAAIVPLASQGVAAETAKIVELSKNRAQYITLSLWIEGQDGDCLNSIFGDTITSTIKFYAKDKTTTGGGTGA